MSCIRMEKLTSHKVFFVSCLISVCVCFSKISKGKKKKLAFFSYKKGKPKKDKSKTEGLESAVCVGGTLAF